jgi:hypothetical protein
MSIPALIQSHANEAYTEIAQNFQIGVDAVAQGSFCYEFSNSLGKRLKPVPVISQVIGVYSSNENLRGVHKFLHVTTPIGKLLVDGTWQQFLDVSQRSPGLPKTAITNQSGMVQLALEAGVECNKASELWVPDLTFEF